MNRLSSPKAPDPCWKLLYRIGGAAALLTALLIPIQVAVFILWMPPLEGTTADWFALFDQNWLVGLVNLDLLLVADNLLLIPIILALYMALGRVNPSAMLIAAALAFLSIILYVVTNPAIEIMGLSGKYGEATTDTQRNLLLAAGEALLAGWVGTAFHVAYFAGSIAGIVYGLVMLRGGVFGKAAGYSAVLGNSIGLGLYIPVIGVYISVFSVVFLEIWYFLVGRKLIQLGQAKL